MLEIQGNIWDYHTTKNPVTITTNLGWNNKNENIMGKGIAKQAAIKFPELSKWYGTICKEAQGELNTVYCEKYNLFLFATKSLNKTNPNLSWKQDSTLMQIEKSLIELRAIASKIIDNIYLPLPGCGAGNLNPTEVVPLLHNYLNNKFILVYQ